MLIYFQCHVAQWMYLSAKKCDSNKGHDRWRWKITMSESKNDVNTVHLEMKYMRQSRRGDSRITKTNKKPVYSNILLHNRFDICKRRASYYRENWLERHTNLTKTGYLCTLFILCYYGFTLVRTNTTEFIMDCPEFFPGHLVTYCGQGSHIILSLTWTSLLSLKKFPLSMMMGDWQGTHNTHTCTHTHPSGHTSPSLCACT